MNSASNEHRTSKRYPAEGCTVKYSPDSIFTVFGNGKEEFIILDISKSGMQFMARERIRVKSNLLLKINASCLKGETIHVNGRVVWVKEAPKLGIHVIGIKFGPMSEQTRHQLDSMIKNAVMEKIKASLPLSLSKVDELRMGINPKRKLKKSYGN